MKKQNTFWNIVDRGNIQIKQIKIVLNHEDIAILANVMKFEKGCSSEIEKSEENAENNLHPPTINERVFAFWKDIFLVSNRKFVWIDTRI